MSLSCVIVASIIALICTNTRLKSICRHFWATFLIPTITIALYNRSLLPLPTCLGHQKVAQMANFRPMWSHFINKNSKIKTRFFFSRWEVSFPEPSMPAPASQLTPRRRSHPLLPAALRPLSSSPPPPATPSSWTRRKKASSRGRGQGV